MPVQVQYMKSNLEYIHTSVQLSVSQVFNKHLKWHRKEASWLPFNVTGELHAG